MPAHWSCRTKPSSAPRAGRGTTRTTSTTLRNEPRTALPPLEHTSTSELSGNSEYFFEDRHRRNVLKRSSATRFRFAVFGGPCPVWNVHRSFSHHGRILVQLAATPESLRTQIFVITRRYQRSDTRLTSVQSKEVVPYQINTKFRGPAAADDDARATTAASAIGCAWTWTSVSVVKLRASVRQANRIQEPAGLAGARRPRNLDVGLLCPTQA
ncbi:short-chain fatty acyl-CoA regulator family protein [Bradyrhizobium sp. CCBAU 25360]|uniref:short-chain fatty acyl-CoA regulator family protein n=1 Tax=Bradyrhizobium sp. CCBAU 25360 TaxID=858425 RepID=UPI003FA4990A